MRAIRTVIGVTGLCLLAACQVAPPRNEPVVSSAASVRIDRYYALMMPGATNLRDVTDDGLNMYLDFAEPAAASTRFFDAQGNELIAVRDGALVGIAGLHTGVLIKDDSRSSFVSVREGAMREMAPQAANTPQIALMRDRLADQLVAARAMQNAMAAVKAKATAASVVHDTKATDSNDPDDKKDATGEPDRVSRTEPGGDVRSTEPMLRMFFGFDRAQSGVPALTEARRGALSQSGRLWITGYTDSVGPSDYNKRLGMRRAQFVADWLADEGIARASMTVRSGGETAFIADNLSAPSRAKNRRVEVRARQ